ncbi:MAG TPA: hypothetical protein VK895_10985 [Jiangellaceae bacterium]|nr:hypothetical protein [Jiangellaceae bacterium]
MSGTDRQRREAVLHEFAMRSRRRAQSQLARRAAAMRSAAALRLAASTSGSSRSSG